MRGQEEEDGTGHAHARQAAAEETGHSRASSLKLPVITVVRGENVFVFIGLPYLGQVSGYGRSLFGSMPSVC